MCMDKGDDFELCLKPKAVGGCNGNYTRWFYNHKEGHCQLFSYSGCLGNNNRFLTESECLNSCLHKAKEKVTDTICKMPIDSGNCSSLAVIDVADRNQEQNQALARWAYDQRLRRCIPFYHTGCGGNENLFESKSECESVCPTSFPPVINMPHGNEFLGSCPI